MYSKVIIDTSFPKAWERAVCFVRQSKQKLNFGGGTENKHAVDSGCEIILDNNAIQDVLNHITHPSDPFATPDKIKEYLKEYEAGFDASRFDYTYRDRLERGFHIEGELEEELRHKSQYITNPLFSDIHPNGYSGHRFLNQLKVLKYGLQKQINEDLSSNRNVAILFNPLIENFSGKSTPCWNEVLVRYEKNNEVSIHTLFRSHDLFGAWESNMIAIVTMLNEEIIKPCNCQIKYVKEHNFSLHIYEYDLPQANNIKIIPRNPMFQRLQTKYDCLE